PDTGALIVIDFDIGKAFLLNRFVNPGSLDSGFVFSPVIRAADARRTGSIRGTVRAQTANGTLLENVNVRLCLGDPNQPENTWSELGTAGTDASGEFVLSFVTPSAHWASVPAQAGKTYQVVAAPYPGSIHGQRVIQNVTVTAGQETNLGVVILP
ncbi:MAG: carboxypeptidase-like regulatory domain-containing protein, partial [Gemmatimonadaceae bacterium]